MLQVEEVSIGWHTQRRTDGRGRMDKGSQMRCTIGTGQEKERGGLAERITLSAKSCLPQSHPQQEVKSKTISFIHHVLIQCQLCTRSCSRLSQLPSPSPPSAAPSPKSIYYIDQSMGKRHFQCWWEYKFLNYSRGKVTSLNCISL